VDDDDIFAVAIQLLSPRMLVTAWESIVLERKVLVMSSVPSLVPPVCEFLRRMALPFVVVNTYVPFLPEALITAVEAPFPYLLGADTHMLLRNRVDLSDSVVFDLDKREVTVPKCDTGAPSSIKALMFEDISRIVSSGLGAWIQRPCSSFSVSSASSLNAHHPLDSYSLNAQANAILQVFIRQNLLLIGARNCWVRGFYRRPTKFKGVDVFGYEDDRSSRITRAENMGYHSPSNQLTCGFLQLHRQCGRLPCWVESDEIGISIYQWADQLPLLFFPYKGLQSISPCSMEPEGHIFEIVLKSQSLYRFQSTDQESRGKWISRIDSLITQANKDEDSSGAGGGGGETSGTVASGGGGGSGLPSPSGDGAESAASQTQGFFAEDGSGLEGKFDNTDDHLLEEDERSVTKFRSLFLQTQMASFLESQMEGVGFVSVLQKLGYNTDSRKVDEDTFSSDGDDFLISNPPLTTVLSVLNKVQDSQQQRTNSSGSTTSATSITATIGGEGESGGGRGSGERSKSELPLPVSVNAGSAELSRLSEPGRTLNDSATDSLAAKTAAAQAQQASAAAAMAAAEQERKSIAKKRGGFFNSIFNRTSKEDIETTASIAAQPSPPSTASAVAHSAISPADADANEISRHNMRSLLSRIATSHKLSTGELQAGLTEIRIEIIAALVQYHANVLRGDEQMRPIEIRINRSSSSPSPSSSTSDSTNGAADAQGKAGATWFKLIWDALGVTSSESVGVGGEGGQSEDTLPPAPPSSSSQKLSSAGGSAQHADESLTTSIREKILSYLDEQLTDASCLELHKPVLQTMKGHIYEMLERSEDALNAYAVGGLVEQERIMTCVSREFIARINASQFSVKPFLIWAKSFSSLVALQAYRLVTQLMHKHIMVKLDDDPSQLDEAFLISSRRYGINGASVGVTPVIPNSGRSNFGIINTSRHGVSAESDQFTWSTNPDVNLSPDTFNEKAICHTSTAAAKPCELSVYLLSRLREILLAYCESPGGQKFTKRTASGYLKVEVGAGIAELKTSSAYANFELQICELQKVDLGTLRNTQEQVVFFVNVYNTLCLHAIIARGTPGSNLLERKNFSRCKYKIGDSHYSMFDIEHGILRNKSSRASVGFGFTVSASFAERDPRRQYVLEEAIPFISFALFTATDCSPPLVVLRNPEHMEAELTHCAKEFVRMYVRAKKDDCTIILPQIFQIYWADLGKTRKDVLECVKKIASPQLRRDIEEILSPSVRTSSTKAKVIFEPLTWLPVIVL